MSSIFSVENLAALVTLTALEIVLGIDNIVFITILTGKLPAERRARVRNIGIGLAVGMRILLLLSVNWVMGLKSPLFTAVGYTMTGKALILLGGGLFLIAKATWEIHHNVERDDGSEAGRGPKHASAGAILAQILALDIVFSLDSVITAVGMARSIPIIIAAVVAAAATMVVFAGPIGGFVERHPAIKMLALAFLVLIGVMLVADGLGQHIPRGYIYFAMAFSLGVELLNIRSGKRGGGREMAKGE